MTLLIKDLRLQLAQLNSFLIANYLIKVQKDIDLPEHKKFIFDSFYSLSESLGALGIAFGETKLLLPETVIPLQKALVDAATVSYLIEKSVDLTDLTETLQRLNSGKLGNSIENIKAYGAQFMTKQVVIDEEISAIIADNADYFNADRSLKHPAFDVSFNDAAAYIAGQSAVAQVKFAFKNIHPLAKFFDAIILNSTQFTFDSKQITAYLLNTLTIILIAFGYIEPFFEQSESTSTEFERLIKKVSALQSAIKIES